MDYIDVIKTLDRLANDSVNQNSSYFCEVLNEMGNVLRRHLAEYERMRRDRDQEVIARDAAEEACEQLRAEVERLKLRQLPDGVEWPVDADGVRIEVGDALQSTCSNCEWKVLGYKLDIRVSSDGGGTFIVSPDAIHHVQPEPDEPEDSWERLEDDADKQVCDYLGVERFTCSECEHKYDKKTCGTLKIEDIVRRAKALAGVEDGR